MNLKQKLSGLVAMVLPMLALGFYLCLAPATASAGSCSGTLVDVQSCNLGGNGGYGCVTNGECTPVGDPGSYVLCKSHGGGGNGPGTCESASKTGSATLCCTYGEI